MTIFVRNLFSNWIGPQDWSGARLLLEARLGAGQPLAEAAALGRMFGSRQVGRMETVGCKDPGLGFNGAQIFRTCCTGLFRRSDTSVGLAYIDAIALMKVVENWVVWQVIGGNKVFSNKTFLKKMFTATLSNRLKVTEMWHRKVWLTDSCPETKLCYIASF